MRLNEILKNKGLLYGFVYGCFTSSIAYVYFAVGKESMIFLIGFPILTGFSIFIDYFIHPNPQNLFFSTYILFILIPSIYGAISYKLFQKRRILLLLSIIVYFILNYILFFGYVLLQGKGYG